MSAKRVKLENNEEMFDQTSGSEEDYPDLNTIIKQEYEFQPATYELQPPVLEKMSEAQNIPQSESNEILSLLYCIKQQLNDVQKDVSEMKKKISSLEKQSLIVCNATSKVSLISEKFETLHKAFKISQQPQPTREVVKPPDYPEQLEFDNYEELSSFDQLLSNYEGPHATYFICFIQKKLGLVTEHMKFMRLGFGLLMTRDLQLKCTFKGSFGYYQTSNMHFLTLLQASCKATTNASPEEIRNYCSTYFIHRRCNEKQKQPKPTPQTITIIDDSNESDNG